MPSGVLISMEEEKDLQRQKLNNTLSIWDQMAYIPPRGTCRQTSSIVSAPCKCLRFMIRPDSAPTSFLCDGCAHHASFHEMRNKTDDAIKARWTRDDGTFDREAYEADEEVQEVLAKRKRLGYHKPMYSSADASNHSMPEKAQRNLLDHPAQGHSQSQSQSHRPEKKRKSVPKTFEEFVG